MKAIEQYKACECPELMADNAVDRLRFFLSCALNEQDWIDVEPFLEELRQAINTLEHDGYKWTTLDGKHYDWYKL